MSNTTNTTTNDTVATANTLVASVPATDLGHQFFHSDNVFPFGTAKWQIDDVIGFTHNSDAAASSDPYQMYHWTQWSTTNVPVAGNILVAWVSYLGWDSLHNATSNVTSQLNTQATVTFTSATIASYVTSKTAGPQDLNLIATGPATVKGNYASSNSSQTGISLSGSWSPATSTKWARFNLGMTQTF